VFQVRQLFCLQHKTQSAPSNHFQLEAPVAARVRSYKTGSLSGFNA